MEKKVFPAEITFKFLLKYLAFWENVYHNNSETCANATKSCIN